MKRRDLLAGSVVAGAMAVAPASLRAALAVTPAQTAGPFYPGDLPLEDDNDLIRVAGRAGMAKGTPLHLFGRVLDGEGRPMREARVEIWQCDAGGIYHHPRDRKEGRDPNFQGFGAATTNAEGAYRFRTIAPVPYSWRTPHIHFKVFDAQGDERLTTQMYIEGEPLNAEDGIYQRLGSPAAKAAVTVALESAAEMEAGGLKGMFDIVVG